jgi:hypothetical protein
MFHQDFRYIIHIRISEVCENEYWNFYFEMRFETAELFNNALSTALAYSIEHQNDCE